MSRRQDRTAKLRAKHPDTTGVYRRPGPGEVAPPVSIWYMLELTERRVRETLDDPASGPEARANAEETRQRVTDLRHLLKPPARDDELPLYQFAVKLASVAMAAGLMSERLLVRRKEDAALHGLEAASARAKGGEATGGARRADALDWRARAEPLAAAAWARHPDWSKSRVADAIAPELGIAAHTVRQQIRKPKNS